MGRERTPRIFSERQLRWILNLYPPLLFQRVRVTEVGRGCRSCRVEVRRSLLTRNLNGTTFGGAIFSAADPFYALLYWQAFARMGHRVRTWLKSGRIRYLQPARTRLTLEFELTDEHVERALRTLEHEGRYECWHTTRAVDTRGVICAEIDTEVYLRLPRADQRETSAF